jgi:hypothetical protein
VIHVTKKKRATDHGRPSNSATQSPSKFHLGESIDIIMMQTIIPHVTKLFSKLTVLQPLKNAAILLRKYFSRDIIIRKYSDPFPIV